MNIKSTVRSHIDRKIALRSIAAAFVFLAVLNITGFGGRYDSIRENVLRLHILANSDSAEDQSLKLKVRDAVLLRTDELFGECENEREAARAAADGLDMLKAEAERVVKENGYAYGVSATVCDMWFEDRVYDDFTLPAGMYEAVRITIGEGKGRNWWCVMFPAVCLPSATKGNRKLGSILDSSETDMCENPRRYIAKFKVVELFEKCRSKLEALSDE